MRVTLQREDPEDPEGNAQKLVEWGAFGFMFVLALLSFADARPRSFSEGEYNEADDLRPCRVATIVRREIGTLRVGEREYDVRHRLQSAGHHQSLNHAGITWEMRHALPDDARRKLSAA